MKKPLTLIAIAAIAFLAGLCVNARYDLQIWSGVPVRFDRWTGNSQIVYPAAPTPAPSPKFNPDSYVAGK